MHRHIATAVGVILVFFAMWVYVTDNPFFHTLVIRLENFSYDSQLRLHTATSSKTPKSPIVIIDIDNNSLKIEGSWPWPRSKISMLVDKLHQSDVDMIVFDMFFSAKAPNIADQLLSKINNSVAIDASCRSSIQAARPFFDEDLLLAKNISSNNSILAFAFLPTPLTENALSAPLLQLTPEEVSQLDLYHATGYISNIGIFQQAGKGAGFINAMPDELDGIIRRSYLIMEYNGGIYPALPLQTILQLYGDKLELITSLYENKKKLEGLKIGNLIIPTDKTGQVFVPFIGKSHTFKYYSATDVLHDNIPQNALAGKIAIIGTTATGLGDIHATAISSTFMGPEIQATLINGILENNFSYQPAWTYGANFSFILILGLSAAFLFPRLGSFTSGVLAITIPILIVLINNWIWLKTNLILSFTIPIMVGFVIAIFNIIYGYFFETRARLKLKNIFGQYVPDEHITEMLNESGNFSLEGEDRQMSVMFSDIRNFTNISENMSAAELVKMLNAYLTPMTKQIFDNGGTVDKYAGDSIMAFWGAPKRDEQHAAHAMLAALSMQATLNAMRATSAEYLWEKVSIGIGINSGVMSVGDMGSVYRRNYTVLGDEVNLASRVESLTKFYHAKIMVTENTKKGQDDFIFRKLDKVKVKGKDIPVELYELICLKKDITPELSEELTRHHDALRFYFNQEWDKALTLFEALHREYPHTALYKIYCDRIREYKITPPPAAWNGCFEHLTK